MYRYLNYKPFKNNLKNKAQFPIQPSDKPFIDTLQFLLIEQRERQQTVCGIFCAIYANVLVQKIKSINASGDFGMKINLFKTYLFLYQNSSEYIINMCKYHFIWCECQLLNRDK